MEGQLVKKEKYRKTNIINPNQITAGKTPIFIPLKHPFF
jgi:hypothetical protein